MVNDPPSELRVGLIGGMMVGLGPISVSILSPALPVIGREFGVTGHEAGSAVTLFLAGYAVFQLICGTLSDGLGRKPVAIFFLSVFGCATLLALFAESFAVLLVARFFQGVGAAVGVSVGRAIVRDNFEGEQSVRVLSLMAVILSVGPSLAPTLGGLIVEVANWHAIFSALALWSVLLVVAITVGLLETRQPDRSALRPGKLIKASRRLFGAPAFVLSTLGVAGIGGSMFAYASVLPFIMIDELGLSPAAFGALMFCQSGMYMSGSLSYRFVARKLGWLRTFRLGLGMVTIGAVLLSANLLTVTGIFTVMGPISLIAWGAAYVMPILMTGAMRDFAEDAGMASSLLGFGQMGLGFLIGSLAGVLDDAVVALATVFPAMMLLGALSGHAWSRLPHGRAPR
ncbi:multidrug effflux MFS transporter [Oceanicola sp. 502str15]|uniref:multidrug effflux MFS transporter n=1 Tax=Oceanicola sp. 502str15 TaxID=2696061 RepID=UPI002095B104|nr:multidrug effflux MFS transporter [Oceanicola sp. 502str15]MCO6385305.1 Bcr/CflA family efflux MFS transporter [Oceanicola sp. 502str15]